VKTLANVLEGIAPVVRDYVVKVLDGVNPRIQALEARIAALESQQTKAEKPRLALRGEWAAAREYHRDDAVLCGHTLWRCRAAIVLAPGPAPGSDGVAWERVDHGAA
jgi:hypothetical protein